LLKKNPIFCAIWIYEDKWHNTYRWDMVFSSHMALTTGQCAKARIASG
jgi:hypothetical protein